MKERFVKVHHRNDELEKMIIAEREERLRQTDEQLKPIREKLKRIFSTFKI
jgi:hypothetical protein